MAFYKEVDKESKNDMVSFLKDHFRYYTDNNWITSYACNMKIPNLDLPENVKNKLYELLDCETAYDSINVLV